MPPFRSWTKFRPPELSHQTISKLFYSNLLLSLHESYSFNLASLHFFFLWWHLSSDSFDNKWFQRFWWMTCFCARFYFLTYYLFIIPHSFSVFVDPCYMALVSDNTNHKWKQRWRIARGFHLTYAETFTCCTLNCVFWLVFPCGPDSSTAGANHQCFRGLGILFVWQAAAVHLSPFSLKSH